MKNKTKLLLTFLLLGIQLNLSYAQPSEEFSGFLEKHYQDGVKAFLNEVYTKIIYPKEARENCGVGYLYVKLTLNEDKGLKKIDYLNPFGYGVEEQVTTILSATNAKWSGLGKTQEVKFKIAFQIGDSPKFKGDINLVDYSIPENCSSNELLMAWVKKFMNKKKYKKALKPWTELVRRGYQGEAFLKLKEEYGENLEKVK